MNGNRTCLFGPSYTRGKQTQGGACISYARYKIIAANCITCTKN